MAAPGGAQLGALPDHVLEKVLAQLPLEQVSKLRAVSRAFREACGRVLRAAVRQLRLQIDAELRAQTARLEAAPADEGCARSFSVIEMLRSELAQLAALCRWPLLGARAVFPAGHLLDRLRALLAQARARTLAGWGAAGDPAAPLLLPAMRFLRAFLASEGAAALSAGMGLRPPLGTRLLDLLDTLLDARCAQDVRWDAARGRLVLRAQYVLPDALFLCLPPDIAALKSQGFVSFADAHRLQAWVALLVRYNNRLRLREEQCLRELHASFGAPHPSPPLRRYPAPAPLPAPALALAHDGALPLADGHLPQRLSVRVRLSCVLRDAPLRVLERWAAATGRPEAFLRALGYGPAASAPPLALDPRPLKAGPLGPGMGMGLVPWPEPTPARADADAYFSHVRVWLTLPRAGGEGEHYAFAFRDGALAADPDAAAPAARAALAPLPFL